MPLKTRTKTCFISYPIELSRGTACIYAAVALTRHISSRPAELCGELVHGVVRPVQLSAQDPGLPSPIASGALPVAVECLKCSIICQHSCSGPLVQVFYIIAFSVFWLPYGSGKSVFLLYVSNISKVSQLWDIRYIAKFYLVTQRLELVGCDGGAYT